LVPFLWFLHIQQSFFIKCLKIAAKDFQNISIPLLQMLSPKSLEIIFHDTDFNKPKESILFQILTNDFNK
jgi:hypothetical protein